MIFKVDQRQRDSFKVFNICELTYYKSFDLQISQTFFVHYTIL